MNFLSCASCGFANELIETHCTRCGQPLDPNRLVSSTVPAPVVEAAPKTPHMSVAASMAGAVVRRVALPLADLVGDYPWAHRFITYVRVVAKVLYVLGILQVLAVLGGGIVASISSASNSGGFLSGTGLIVGGIIVSIIAAIVTYLFVWLGYMFLMALPDMLECILRIESNTRAAS